MVKDEYDVQEASSFFQGHIDQFFSRNRLSFQINSVYSDPNKINEFNAEKFRPFIINTISRLIEARRGEGFDAAPLDKLKLVYPRLVDSSKDEGLSGRYSIFPKTGICTACKRYLKLDGGDNCNCNAPIEQFTFIAFCDECGAKYPIHAMSNVGKNCKKCGKVNALWIMAWDRKDDLGSYYVECVNCHQREKLYLLQCDHRDHITGKVRSTNPKNKFRGVPTRGGSIYHPYVLSVPDIPHVDELNKTGSLNTNGRQLTEAYNEFCNQLEGMDESRLYLPEFWNLLIQENDFWVNGRICEIAEDLNLAIGDRSNWSSIERWRVLRNVLVGAKNRIVPDETGKSNKDLIVKKYSIDSIVSSIKGTSGIHFDEQEKQGMSLLTSDEVGCDSPYQISRREMPKQVPPNWNKILEKYGIENVILISNLYMVQMLLGIIEGSTRREVLLFRTIQTGSKEHEDPTIFLRRFKTEGVVFKLDSGRIIEWLENNGFVNKSDININDPKVALRNLVQSREEVRQKVDLVLHTLSHLLIQQSSIDTGLDAQSLSEIVYPSLASILIYSTSSVDIGGIEYTYDNHMSDWLNRIEELAHDCSQDPACMEDEGGACNACLLLPEFVCKNFNQNLDRGCLIGGPRYGFGFFRG
jgi:hypothetical protein